MQDRSERFAPVTGVLFAITLILSFLFEGDTPGIKASGDTVINFYNGSATVTTSIYFDLVSAVMFVLFAATLRTRLQRTLNNWLSAAVLAGTAIFAAGLGLFAIGSMALIDSAHVKNAAVSQALNIFGNDDFMVCVIGLSTVYLATGLHAITTKSMPKWFGWVSLVLGLLCFAGPVGFLAFLLVPIWAIAASVIMFRSPVAASASTQGAVSEINLRDPQGVKL